MIDQLSQRQGVALAQFIHSIRNDWDVPGIQYALGQARSLAPAADVALAAIRAASTPSNRSPAVIPLEGPHWRAATTPPFRRYQPHELCTVCSQPEHVCRSRWQGDHSFEAYRSAPAVDGESPRAAALDQLRAAHRDAAAALCPHRLDRGTCRLCKAEATRSRTATPASEREAIR